MKESLAQTFENSQQATDSYIAYISRQNSNQEEGGLYSLDSVMEDVNIVGQVAAMAAQESMASHKSIFQMLYVMNEAQGALTDIIIDWRLNGGSGGDSGGELLMELLQQDN